MERPGPSSTLALVSNRGGRMRKKVWVPLALGLLLLLLLPATSLADANDLKAAIDGKLKDSVGINSTWVIVAGGLVMFMQAGVPLPRKRLSRREKPGGPGGENPPQFSLPPPVWGGGGLPLAGTGPAGLG